MKFAPGASALRLSALALQLVDRSFDQRLIRQQGREYTSELISELDQALSEAGELLPGSPILYAHKHIAYRFARKEQEKNAIS